MSSYKSFFNPTNMLVVVALLALILFRHSLFPEATESTEVKQLMGKMDSVIDTMQNGDEAQPEQQASSVTPGKGGINSETAEPTVAADESAEEERVATESVAPADIADDPSGSAQMALDVWQTARRAAWDGNSDAAVENYRALIQLQPENYDAYGEMGNVMLQQGDTQGAVDAFSQAATLLQQSGYQQAAWHVINIVAQLDQTRADALHKTLSQQSLPSTQ